MIDRWRSDAALSSGIRAVGGAATAFAAYAAWSALFRLLALTLITWLLQSPLTSLRQVNDAFTSVELPLTGLGITLYVVVSRMMRPERFPRWDDFVTTWRVEKRFLPGALAGAAAAATIAVFFLLGGSHRILGLNLDYDEAPVTLINALLRTLTIAGLCYAEEHLLRTRITDPLRRPLGDLGALLAGAVAYVVIKSLQFDLGWMHMITLFLVSLMLGLRILREGDFGRSAGGWAGFLILAHVGLGLPVFGNEFPGILMMQFISDAASRPELHRWLTGGAGGPLSSAILQLALAAECIRLHRLSSRPGLSRRS